MTGGRRKPAYTAPVSTAPPPRWTRVLPPLLTLLLGVWTIGQAGFVADDWMHLLAASGTHPSAGPFDLYRWASGQPAAVEAAQAAGLAPWWTDPHLEIALFRPLSSALTHADLWLFGHHPTGHLLHSLAWAVGGVAAMHAVFRRLLPPWTALLAAVIFAVAPSQVASIGWLAARNGLIACALGALGWLAVIRGRTAWGILGLAGALLAGEAGLAWIALASAWLVVAVPDRRRTLVGLAGVVVGWGIAYLALGYGTAHSGVYVNPVSEPLAWLARAPVRAGVASGVLTVGLPADLGLRPLSFEGWFALVGVLLSAPVWAWMGTTMAHLDAESRRPVLALALGTVLAVIPALSGPLGPWSFIGPGAGAAGLVAVLVADAWPPQGGLLRLRRLGAAGLLGAHVLGAGATWVVASLSFGGLQARTNGDASLLAGEDRPTVVLSAPDLLMPLYGAARQRAHGNGAPILALSMAPGDHRLTRTGPQTLVLESDAGWFDARMSRLGTRPERWTAGRSIGVQGWTITVVDSPVHAVQLESNRALSTYRFIGWHQGDWVDVGVPEAGQTTTLQWQPPGLW